MWTMNEIREHINNLPDSQLFTTRDLLSYGKRASVDQALCRLVKRGEILRLARGVFIKNVPDQRVVGALEIAFVKAKAFGKMIMTHAEDCAIKASLLAGPHQYAIFEVNGHSSSFLTNNGRINLQGVSARKFHLGDEAHGRLIRALWYLKKLKIEFRDFDSVIRQLTESEWLKLRRNARWMPSWLSDIICHRSFSPTGP